ncbi:MAG: hypothetical protein HQM09_09830 [Candidatus Riflebacteria bacterium]|nr:hypothetical protein [Candidatus Riflebacteria bacterium]
MLTLIIKEMRELFWHFVVLVLFGLASMGAIMWYKVGDFGVLGLLLLVIANPIFITLYTSQAVSGEVQRATLPFLVSLPVSRHRLWLAKTASYLLFAIGLSLIYGLVVWSITPATMNGAPDSEELILLIYLPVMLVAISMFTTMLPASTVIAFLIIAALFGSTILLAYISRWPPNYYIASPLLVVVFFAASYQAFLKGELMDSWKPCFWGAGTLVITGLLAFGFWMCLDMAADNDFTANKLFIDDLKHPLNGTVPILTGMCNTSWFDTLYHRSLPRTFTIDPQTGATRQIGPRGCAAKVVSPDGRYLAANALRRHAGLVTGDNLLIFDLAKNGGSAPITESSSLKTGIDDFGMTVIKADADSYPTPIAFIDQDHLLYHRFAGGYPHWSMELCLAEIGSGTRVLCAFDWGRVSMYYLPASGWVLVQGTKTAFLVHPETGKRLRLPVTENIGSPFGQIASMSLLRCERRHVASRTEILLDRQDSREEKKRKIRLEAAQTEIMFYGITTDGTLATQSWIATGTVWISDEPKPLALVQTGPATSTATEEKRAPFAFVRLDLQANASETLATFLARENIHVCSPATGSRYLMLYNIDFLKDGQKVPGTMRFDTQTHQLDVFPSPNSLWVDLRAIDRDRYLALGKGNVQSVIWNLDAMTGEYRQILKSQQNPDTWQSND